MLTKKIGKMAKVKSIGGLTPALTIAGGFIAANLAGKFLNNIPLVNTPIGQAVAKAGLGIFLMGSKSASLKGVGTGMVVNAATSVITSAVPALNPGTVNGLRGVDFRAIQQRSAEAAAQNGVQVASGVVVQ